MQLDKVKLNLRDLSKKRSPSIKNLSNKDVPLFAEDGIEGKIINF